MNDKELGLLEEIVEMLREEKSHRLKFMSDIELLKDLQLELVTRVKRIEHENSHLYGLFHNPEQKPKLLTKKERYDQEMEALMAKWRINDAKKVARNNKKQELIPIFNKLDEDIVLKIANRNRPKSKNSLNSIDSVMGIFSYANLVKISDEAKLEMSKKKAGLR